MRMTFEVMSTCYRLFEILLIGFTSTLIRVSSINTVYHHQNTQLLLSVIAITKPKDSVAFLGGFLEGFIYGLLKKLFLVFVALRSKRKPALEAFPYMKCQLGAELAFYENTHLIGCYRQHLHFPVQQGLYTSPCEVHSWPVGHHLGPSVQESINSLLLYPVD